jgi:hypothetical protein
MCRTVKQKWKEMILFRTAGPKYKTRLQEKTSHF